ncbi:hypothetical protein KSS87_011540, partial [Heliosperma pusillum]
MVISRRGRKFYYAIRMVVLITPQKILSTNKCPRFYKMLLLNLFTFYLVYFNVLRLFYILSLLSLLHGEKFAGFDFKTKR